MPTENKNRPKKRAQKTLDMVSIALCAVLIAVCSWITVPMPVPFTMQTFGVFAALGLLGGKRGTIAFLVYILLGAVGVPVFSGFKSGAGVLLGPTGGYIAGFLLSALLFWLLTAVFGKGTGTVLIAMLMGLLMCYVFGTLWFKLVYTRTTGAVGWLTAIGWCVAPFVLPDLLKIALAYTIAKLIPRYIKI